MYGSVLWAALLAAAAAAAGVCAAPEPVVAAPAGPARGSWLRSRRGRPLAAFRGLRYAAPPVGELRFKPPQPEPAARDEIDARSDGPACPQPAEEGYYVDEDCLRLNVYTPRINSTGSGLPVVVFLHAGGFYSVSGRSDVAGPDYLLDEELVLVTANYRLGSLGFLSTGDEFAPGNNGLKDQVLALRWVQRNIAAFGGDPGRVTLAGYSAGAFSVALHMVSPMSKGLFHRAIAMSGSPISQIPVPPHQRALAERQAALAGCPHRSSREMLACLRNKTADEIGNSLDGFFEYAYDPVLVWTPVVEPDCGQERFLAEHPLTSLRAGRAHPVPCVISQTTGEFFWKAFTILGNASLSSAMGQDWRRMAAISFQLPAADAAADALRAHYLGPGSRGPLANDSHTADALGRLYSHGVIGFGVHTLVNALAVYSPHPVYYYRFDYIGNNSHYMDPATHKPTGVAHHDDLIYLFSINVSFPLIAPSGSQDSRMVDYMTGMWRRFAATGNPNPTAAPGAAAPSGAAWPPFTRSARRYLNVKATPAVQSNMFEEDLQVWENLYNKRNCDFCTY
uniref:Carboxylic ester hydrolase n=1 Tax=Ectropis obliqua TaxID=248899 RepID=A0A2S0D932_ECTOB|nr:putative antennal esterase CXE16 [Ectropis obliqua]